MTTSKEEILSLLERVEGDLTEIKDRYNFLKAFFEEFDRIAPGGMEIGNHYFWRLIRDSYRILTNDMASLSKYIAKDFLNKLKSGPPILIGQAPDKLKTRLKNNKGAGKKPDEFYSDLSRHIREALERLFPSIRDQRPSHADFDELAERIRQLTASIISDRDRIHAHLYEKEARDPSLKIETEWKDFAAIFSKLEQLFSDIVLITKHYGTSFDLVHRTDREIGARDLVDLIEFGSINQATIEVGLVKHPELFSEEDVYYHQFRKKFRSKS